MEKCKRELFGLIIAYIVAVIAFYIGRFGCSFSECKSDWANFGNYLGGMVSIISIVLLFFTLREQQKGTDLLCEENFRLRIEAGYNRMLDSLTKKYYEKKDLYDLILNAIYANKSERESSAEIRGIYENAINKLLIIDLYNTYAYIIEGIENESRLDSPRKEHYFQNLIYSLPTAVNVIILSFIIYLSAKDEDNTDLSKSQDWVKKTKIDICRDNNMRIIVLLNKYEPYRNYGSLIIDPTNRNEVTMNGVEGIRKVRNNFLFMIFSSKK